MLRWLKPHRCVSLRPDSTLCRNRVPTKHQRCDACWNDLSNPSTCSNVPMRVALCREPDIPTTIVERLANDPSMMVRIALAETPAAAASERTLTLLHSDPEPVVRLQFTRNLAVNATWLIPLTDDPDPTVAEGARWRTATEHEPA